MFRILIVNPTARHTVDVVSPDSGELLGRKGKAFAESQEERVLAEVRHPLADLRRPLRSPIQLVDLSKGRARRRDPRRRGRRLATPPGAGRTAQNHEQQLTVAAHHEHLANEVDQALAPAELVHLGTE